MTREQQANVKRPLPKITFNYLNVPTARRSKTYLKSEELTSSELVQDQPPSKPTRVDPLPRIIEPRKIDPSKRLNVFLTAGSLLTYQQQCARDKREAEFMQRTTQQQTSSANLPPRIFIHGLDLITFRPLLSPFVPDLLRYLVNYIESYCYENQWNALFDPLEKYFKEGAKGLTLLVKNQFDIKQMKNIIEGMSHQARIVAMRMFLNELSTKPLTFQRREIIELSKVPLFDLFLRPNPGLREVIKHSALSASSCQVDTLAFLAIHLLHAWEAAYNPIVGRIKLASIYGPLMVQFAQRPIVFGSEFSQGKTLESALFEVLLETCDSHFWNHLTSLKLRPAFESTSKLGQIRITPNSDEQADSFYISQPMNLSDLDEHDSETFELPNQGSMYTFYQAEEKSGDSIDLVVTPDEMPSVISPSKTEPSFSTDPTCKPLRQRPVMSFISYSMPPLLSLADVHPEKVQPIRVLEAEVAYRNKASFAVRICRSTGQIVRDVSKQRIEMQANPKGKHSRKKGTWFRAHLAGFEGTRQMLHWEDFSFDEFLE